MLLDKPIDRPFKAEIIKYLSHEHRRDGEFYTVRAISVGIGVGVGWNQYHRLYPILKRLATEKKIEARSEFGRLGYRKNRS